jgi:methylmalonyl-CoA mutase N-terminal domain/subunit
VSTTLERWTALAAPDTLAHEIDPGVEMPPFVHESQRADVRVAGRTPALLGFNPPPGLRGEGWDEPLPIETDYAYALAPTDRMPVLAGLTDPLLNPDDTGQLPDGQQPDVAAHVLHEWGATIVEELTFLALGAAHHEHIRRVSLAVDQRPLVSAAKVMAARVLLANLEVDAPLLAITSGYVQTAYAAHNNRTRGTLGALGAFLGGADLLAVRPHTWATGSVAIRDVRDALNVGRVIRDEAYLGAVETPAAGSRWTALAAHKLAHAAWERAGKAGDARTYAERAFETAQRQHEERLSAQPLVVGVTRHAQATDALPSNPLPQSRETGFRLTGVFEAQRRAQSTA